MTIELEAATMAGEVIAHEGLFLLHAFISENSRNAIFHTQRADTTTRDDMSSDDDSASDGGTSGSGGDDSWDDEEYASRGSDR